MGYLSCRAESSIATCRSISATDPSSLVATTAAAAVVDRDPTSLRRFTYTDLEAATTNFSDRFLLGRGSHGAVYKALLRGAVFAVKRPSRRPTASAEERISEVENEIQVLSRITSPRIVNLIGFTSDRSKDRLLVTEFMPNGTLYDMIHSNPRPPGWSRRLKLALQSAKSVLALHSADPQIIHRDIKSANILIDGNYRARLGDFGLAIRNEKLALAKSTPPAGTLGYLDPGYVTPENLSTKTDVFSFGILLFEIISGRKAIDVQFSPPSVVEWAVPLVKKGKVLSLFDPRIPLPRDPNSRRQLAVLAASCVRATREKRPSMEDVVEQLETIIKTAPVRNWSGLSAVNFNPCSVVDTETTALSKSRIDNVDASDLRGDDESGADDEVLVVGPVRNARTAFSDVAGNGRSMNLKDLMATMDDEKPIPEFGIRVRSRQRAGISRARTLYVDREYYGRECMTSLPRNRTVRAVPVEMLLRPEEFRSAEGKPQG